MRSVFCLTAFFAAIFLGATSSAAKPKVAFQPFLAECNGQTFYGNLIEHKILTTTEKLYHVIEYQKYDIVPESIVNKSCVEFYLSKTKVDEQCAARGSEWYCWNVPNGLKVSLDPDSARTTVTCNAESTITVGSRSKDLVDFLTSDAFGLVDRRIFTITAINGTSIQARGNPRTVTSKGCVSVDAETSGGQ